MDPFLMDICKNEKSIRWDLMLLSCQEFICDIEQIILTSLAKIVLQKHHLTLIVLGVEALPSNVFIFEYILVVVSAQSRLATAEVSLCRRGPGNKQFLQVQNKREVISVVRRLIAYRANVKPVGLKSE